MMVWHETRFKEPYMTQFNSPMAQGAATDMGLRSFMLGTYRYMVMAMIVSMGVAWAFGNYGLLNVPFAPEMGLSNLGRMMMSPVAAIGLTFGIIFAFGAVGSKLTSMSLSSVKMFLFGFAAIMGVWLSAIAVFVNPMISAKIFFMAAAAFAGVSLIGYVTKKDLGTFAKFCMMAFFGYVAFRILGMFFPSLQPTGAMDHLVSVLGLVAICGITAWETQTLKRTYYAMGGNAEMAEKYSAFGAASLLLSFINIFSILMNLFGNE